LPQPPFFCSPRSATPADAEINPIPSGHLPGGDFSGMNGNWQAGGIFDKQRILAFLETDRLYAAYAIGDLEPELFADCAWTAAQWNGEIRALGLHFRALAIPAFFLMGEPDGVHSILQNHLPSGRVYLTCREEILPVVRRFYHWEEGPCAMWRMALGKNRRQMPAAGGCVRLTGADSGRLAEFYAAGGAIGFNPAQIENGFFFGRFAGTRLAAAAGTHLVSARYGVAAVGNILTHPDFRGRGYGSDLTTAVLKELIRLGIRDIVLNVRQDNAPALHLYEKLGLDRHCAFWEGPASVGEAANAREEADGKP
jgi:ribosomal protein S18 acetylase RimI-like enzyme